MSDNKVQSLVRPVDHIVGIIGAVLIAAILWHGDITLMLATV